MMGLQHSRIVYGYHGCDASVAEALLGGGKFKESSNDYDWLGRGVYFWEYGPDRAARFAKQQVGWGRAKTPAVVGAVIQLGTCFDLLDTRFTKDLAEAFPRLKSTLDASGIELPKNEGKPPDHKLRKADCAVLNWYMSLTEQENVPYDTVRGSFQEGKPVFDGSLINGESHIQIAVRNPECILGVFRPTAFSSFS
jgi:hypothetical protein